MSFLLVFIASLFGSPHCAAMCGGFVAVASQGAQPKRSQALYHSGRLVTYLFLGLVAGAVGEGLNKVGNSWGVTDAAALITGVLLLASGFAMLAGRSLAHKFLPLNALGMLHKRIVTSSSGRVIFPFALGFSSTFLPCGWLYTYVSVAAAAGSVFSATVTMFAFWLGTLPILITIGSIANLITGFPKKIAPIIGAVLIILAGAFSLVQHLGLNPLGLSGHEHCHEMQESN